MDTKNYLHVQQHGEPVRFMVFRPDGEDSLTTEVKKTRKAKIENPVDKEMEKQMNEMFFDRNVLAGLGAYIYRPNFITGGIFVRYRDKEKESYTKVYDASQILKDNAKMPELILINPEEAKKRTYHKVDKANINFLAKFFPFFMNTEKDKCVELGIRDEATSICDVVNIDREKIGKIVNDIKEKSQIVDDYYFIQSIISTSIEQNILDEINIKSALDGVFIKIDGGYYSAKKESKKEIKISGNLIPLSKI